MSKNIKRNTRALQTTYDNYKNRLTQDTKAKIQNLINFYEDRKKAQFTTADNLIRQFITAKTGKQKAKANTAYDKIHDKHHDKEPLGQRMREAKTNTANLSMYNMYIQTPLDPEFETFKEAINVKHYKENECWFNTITDWYKDTLMGEKRRGFQNERGINTRYGAGVRTLRHSSKDI